MPAWLAEAEQRLFETPPQTASPPKHSSRISTSAEPALEPPEGLPLSKTVDDEGVAVVAEDERLKRQVRWIERGLVNKSSPVLPSPLSDELGDYGHDFADVVQKQMEKKKECVSLRLTPSQMSTSDENRARQKPTSYLPSLTLSY